MKIWEIEKAARNVAKNNEAWHTVMSAIENAIDVTKSDSNAEFETVALRTLKSNLCDEPVSEYTISFFQACGVRW